MMGEERAVRSERPLVDADNDPAVRPSAEQARGAQRDLIVGQPLGERLADLAKVGAAPAQVERHRLIGRHGAKVILQILPP